MLPKAFSPLLRRRAGTTKVVRATDGVELKFVNFGKNKTLKFQVPTSQEVSSVLFRRSFTGQLAVNVCGCCRVCPR